MPRQTPIECAKAVVQIREKNDRMLIRHVLFYLLSLTSEIAKDNNIVLSDDELNAFHYNSAYKSNFAMSDEEDS